MGFIMDGLDAEEFDRSYSDRQLVRRIVSYFKPHRRKMLIAAGGIVLTALLDLVLPVFISFSIDAVAENASTMTFVWLALGLAFISSLSWVFNAIRQTLSSQAVGDVVLDLREDAIDAVLKRDLSFYDTYASGKIVSRVNSDTQSFTQVIVLCMELLSRVLLVIFLLLYLLTISAELTLILIALSPIIVGCALAFRALARKTVTQSRRVTATVNSHIQETVSGIAVAKTFRQEEALHSEFSDVNKTSRLIYRRNRFVFSSIFPVLNGLAAIGTATLVYWGGLRLNTGSLSVGDWFLFIQGLSLFWFPLTSIASFWSQFQLGLAAGERVFALIDADPAVVQIDSQSVTGLKGEIEFRNVNFSYKPGEPVLQDFSLHIQPGEMLALVGHTGSGKSSIAKLVSRFYEFQGGTILIDGQDIRTFDLGSYRSHLGIVTQTPFLFTGTVRDNIRYGRPDASDAEVDAVAQTIAQGDWIKVLPKGLDTEVIERGSNLAMGQRQIIALARILLQDPAIVILDEATASIDPLTETLIQEGLDVVLADRTSIVIAHRLSTIRHADRIIVLQKGEILEQGRHDELMKQGGHYADLYNTYFRHQSLEYIEQRVNS